MLFLFKNKCLLFVSHLKQYNNCDAVYYRDRYFDIGVYYGRDADSGVSTSWDEQDFTIHRLLGEQLLLIHRFSPWTRFSKQF